MAETQAQGHEQPRSRFDAVLDVLEADLARGTNRVTPGTIILGQLGNIRPRDSSTLDHLNKYIDSTQPEDFGAAAVLRKGLKDARKPDKQLLG